VRVQIGQESYHDDEGDVMALAHTLYLVNSGPAPLNMVSIVPLKDDNSHSARVQNDYDLSHDDNWESGIRTDFFNLDHGKKGCMNHMTHRGDRDGQGNLSE
jgi:hypothetical protein